MWACICGLREATCVQPLKFEKVMGDCRLGTEGVAEE
jgi:hypothetical protein